MPFHFLNQRHKPLFGMIVLAVGLLALSGCTAVRDIVAGPTLTPPPPNGTRIEPPIDVPADITLTSHTGEPLSFGDLRGRYSLIYFGYTHCPDVCPLTLAEFNRVALTLGEDADRVNFVMVSVDGRRDTPERLAAYLPSFNPDFIGLTTVTPEDEASLTRATEVFGIYYEYEEVEDTAADYLVAHTASTFLLNPEGQYIITYPYQTPPEIIAGDIQQMLQEE